MYYTFFCAWYCSRFVTQKAQAQLSRTSSTYKAVFPNLGKAEYMTGLHANFSPLKLSIPTKRKIANFQ
jgi:hypothetical protein